MDELLPQSVNQALADLRSDLARLPRATRQACAMALAAKLVEEAAYFTAEDEALPLTTRLLLLANDLQRISGQFNAAAA